MSLPIPNAVDHHSPLARRLIIHILLFSSFITLLGTAYQLYAEFRRDVRAIHAELEQVQKSHLDAIRHSVWVYDLDDLNVQLKGILRLPDIQFVEVTSDKGMIAAVGKFPEKKTIRRRFMLTREHRGRQVSLGTLTVAASMRGVHRRLMDRAIVILLTQGVKTFLVTAYIFFLFYSMVARHLEAVARQGCRLDMESLDEPFSLNRRNEGRKRDELDQVIDALNEMRTRLGKDLQKLRDSEAASRESEMKFRQLAENIPEVFWLGTPDVGEIHYISPAYEAIWGKKAESLYGTPMSWLESVHEEDREKIRAYFPMRWTRPYQPRIFPEYRLVRPNGDIRFIHARAFPILDEAGEMVRVAGIAEDITERRTAEAEARNSARLLSEVTEGTTDAIFIKDRAGRYILANTATCEALGRPREDVLGKTDRDLFPEASFGVIEAVDSRVIREGKPVICEERLQTSGGETIWMANKSPQLDHRGNIIGLIGISRDITEIKSIEREKEELEHRLVQAQKLESLGNLAGGIAHDFNNLLFPILGMAEMLLEDLPKESPERANVQVIFDAAQRGGELAGQILAFSRRSEQGKSPLRLQQILKEVLRLCRSSIPSDIDIRQNISASCGSVMGNPTQMHQVAMNLITNAYHALGQEGGIIEVRLEEVQWTEADSAVPALSPGGYVRFSVSDTGEGIPPDIRDKIFEPYFTTKGKGKGTGLGLALVYGIARGHGGDIQLESEEGKGTTFSVYLPVMEHPAAPEPAEDVETRWEGRERILLVDDEEAIAMLERQMLERLGYRVHATTNSEEALRTFAETPHRFDLVITDMTMPKMTGDRLAAELLAIRPNVPVIICTGYSERLTDAPLKRLGVKSVLMKPVRNSEMARTVRMALDEAGISQPEAILPA